MSWTGRDRERTSRPNPARPARDFAGLVAAVVAAIDPGRVASYGQVAAWAGRPGAARAVGNVLAASSGLPWWRVVHVDGRLLPGSAGRQRALLEREGVAVDGDRIADPRLIARLRPDPLEAP